MSHPLAQLAAKRRVRVAGLMSGTSADGVDAAVVDVHGRAVDLVAFHVYPYPPAVRKAVLDLCRPESARLDDICHYNHVLGELFADAVVALCREAGIPLRSIDLIGSHGQTICHLAQGRRYGRRIIRSTLQIGEPAVIAHRTGITTVADFRPRDMAAGGQGAPLVPYADYRLFRHHRLSRVVQNIGGIANLTFLPARCGADDVMAFDTGPGNMVIDGVVRIVTRGRRQYDADGAMAVGGTPDPRLLKEMLRHPFLRRRPPKSTGREQFGQEYCQWLLDQARQRGLGSEDLVATATAFTAITIAQAYRRFLPHLPEEVILCGGGAHNATLVRMLREQLAEVTIRSMDEFGISVDAKEAVSFALLALATIQGRPNNMPGATGATEPVILGKIVPAR